MKTPFLFSLGSLVLLLMVTACSDPACENTVIREIEHPSNGKKMILLDRNCGATTALSRQVSLLMSHEKLQNEAGNIYTSTGYDHVEVRWINAEHLQITRVGKGKDFTMKKSHLGVTISYQLKP